MPKRNGKAVADALLGKQPNLGTLMGASRDDVLAMTFLREHWEQIASTKPLERVNREFTRRAEPMASFPMMTPSSTSWGADVWRPTTDGLWHGAT
ncbi:hypothetical protein MES4922_10287 [Mesorhizobium ventifaucium]|uniref:Uncharacterized protein n=1 Tax=Mesorhizobium ventifaucium TaxID=666020 RepID=A0ABM9DF07_9HYPH|nr:hypothetical protein MES4922_10287 [Mesorhizobium ventifaucium]